MSWTQDHSISQVGGKLGTSGSSGLSAWVRALPLTDCQALCTFPPSMVSFVFTSPCLFLVSPNAYWWDVIHFCVMILVFLIFHFLRLQCKTVPKTRELMKCDYWYEDTWQHRKVFRKPVFLLTSHWHVHCVICSFNSCSEHGCCKAPWFTSGLQMTRKDSRKDMKHFQGQTQQCSLKVQRGEKGT